MGNLIKGAAKEANEEEPDITHKGLGGEVLVVTGDYPSPLVSKPIFRMGEKLTVLAQEASWWRVRSVRTRTENYIPNTHVAKVYHGWLFEGLERQKAEALLQMPCNVLGSFLVRESTSDRGVYSLSVKHRGVQHYRICRMDNSWYYISPRLTFQCLEDMISHYSECADGLCCTLSCPCLSGTSAEQPNTAPPVVMRRNFNWKDVDRRTFHEDADGVGTAMSYGVRNSMAAYMSLSGALEGGSQKRKNRNKKSKSALVPSWDYDPDDV
ncbi:src like adaptor 1a [Gadus chalcogrammus]|uniref:src like adaptor 1a n=1 Tax=Gadus chalcogrammus TaxID=1042646 RepID=UPI0024C4E1FF|nr:src like adaptor 1a [Gadus chalcogrammus]